MLKGKPIDFKSKVWKGISHIVGQSEVKEEKREEDNNNSSNSESNSINNHSQNNRASLEVPREATLNANEDEGEEIAFWSQSIVDYSDAASNM